MLSAHHARKHKTERRLKRKIIQERAKMGTGCDVCRKRGKGCKTGVRGEKPPAGTGGAREVSPPADSIPFPPLSRITHSIIYPLFQPGGCISTTPPHPGYPHRNPLPRARPYSLQGTNNPPGSLPSVLLSG